MLRYTEFFEKRLQDGSTVRLAMVDSNNEAVCKAMSPLLKTSLEGFVSDLHSSPGLVNRLNQATHGVGKLEIRFIEFVPTLSLVVVDANYPLFIL